MSGWTDFRDKYVIGSPWLGRPDERVKKEIEVIEGAAEDITGKTGERAASEAARTQAEAITQQLDYLKEINKLPQQYKEEALTELRNIAFEPGAQEDMIEKIRQSPMYQQIMGGKAAGEEAVMRASSVTGGLRSGNVQEALYDYNVGLEREALSEGYGQQMAGLQRLAGIPTNERQIGQTYGDIGAVRAAGITGAAQARQAGTANMLNLGLGLGGLALGYAGLPSSPTPVI